MINVSVCVPVYNGANHLSECLRSIAEQQGVALEIVVGDDSSTDNSLEIVESIRREFPSVTWNILRNTDRLGMAGNWNACVEAASGDLVKVMGQDDILYPRSLERQVSALSADPEIVLCACSADILSAKGKKILKRKRNYGEGVHDGNKMISKCLHRAFNFIGEPVTAIFRKADLKRVGGFDSSMSYFIDLDLWVRLLIGKKYSFINDALCGFRIHRRGASFSLQGEGYGEFLRLEKKVDFWRPLAGLQLGMRKLKAISDSTVRLTAYQILGLI
jgi:glycosyltransferase involved in cell wall biosynthesis